MMSFRNFRPVLSLMVVVMTTSFVAVSDALADDCLDCSTDPPPPLDASCPVLDDANPDPLLFTNEHAETTGKVGKIADAFSVSSTGEASYRLALEVPPGRAGMAPQISLSYDSSSGSGLVGMGFSLGGFSSIARCGSNVAQDGRLRGVSYDSEDNFCLDGLRLVKVTHVELPQAGQCFDEYRTFPDTFRRVRAHCAGYGNEASSPAWFQVFTKNGRVVDYGHDAIGTPNGRVMGKNGLIRAWWVTQESDRRGNAIQYLYRNETDPVDGHTVTHVPQRINYTAFLGGAGKAPTSAVVFDASDAALNLTGFVGGMEVSRRPRLDKIRMLGLNDAPVRSYQLVWDDTALPGRSRISEIVECAEDNTSKCRPPTRLTWLDQPGQGFNFNEAVDTGIAYTTVAEPDCAFEWMMTDVTGDGLADLVTTRTDPTYSTLVDWSVARNLGGEYAPSTFWQDTAAPSYLLSSCSQFSYEQLMTFNVVPQDYDQDGVTDILFSDPAGGEIGWLRSPVQGDGFTTKSTGVFIPEPIAINHLLTSRARYADVDGDGVLDLIQCNEIPISYDLPTWAQPLGDWYVRRWSPGGSGVPAGFGASEAIPWLNSRSCDIVDRMNFVDLDGDGKTEIVVPQFGYFDWEGAVPAGTAQTSPMCNGPCTFESIQWRVPLGGGAPGWTRTDTGLQAPDWSIGDSSRTLFLDVNGDGLPDAVSSGNALYPGQLVTSINTGTGFLFGQPSLVGYSAEQAAYLDFSATLDFNGDGRMDLLLPMESALCLPYTGAFSCWVVLQSAPAAFGTFEFRPLNIPFSTADWVVASARQRSLTPRVTDINGDGRADVVMPIDGTLKVFINEGPRDLLHTVTDGMNPLEPGDTGFLPDVAIEYGTLLDHAKTAAIDPTSPAAENETYLPRTDPANDCEYPRTCVVGSKRVVSSYTVNNGQNQARSFSMRYRDGRAHRLGRGFLGFGTVLTVEDSQNSGRAEVYDNVTFDNALNTFPFAGSFVRSWSWVPEWADSSTKIAFTSTDVIREERYSVYSAGLPLSYFTLPVENRTRKSESIDSGAVSPLTFVAELAANPGGELLDTKSVVKNYDNYGNVLAEERTTVDVDDLRTVTRTAVNDATTWRLGEVTNETACSTSLGKTKCQATSRSYTDWGEVETEDRGDPSDPHTTRKTVFTRDDFGNPILMTAEDAFGNHRSACITYEKEGIFPYAYSQSAGQVSRIAFDAGLGVPTASKDPNGLTTVWQHDAFGRTTRETRPDGVTTELDFRRLKTGGPGSTWWALYIDTATNGFYRSREEFDSRGRAVRSWTKGPQVAAKNDESHSSTEFTAPEYEVETIYDLLGRVAERSNPWLTTDPDSEHLYTKYEYDTRGRTLSMTSPWGYTTRYDYSGNTVVTSMPADGSMLATSTTTTVDPLGRTIAVIDAKGERTLTTYGHFGAPRSVESPAGLFETFRDSYGRVTAEVDPDRGVTTIEYNGFDEQTLSVDAANRVINYTYDTLGRRVQRLDDGVLSTKWRYDDPAKGYGRLAYVQNLGGATKSYTYDSMGRISSVALLLDGETFTSTYQYDAFGNVDTVAYPQGPGGASFRIKNEYDLFNNLVAVRDDVDATHPYYWRLDRVNGTGQTSREIFGNNELNQGHALSTERDYSLEKGTLSAIRTTAGVASVQDIEYGYDARLNLTGRTYGGHQPGINPATERFKYDELDRLASAKNDTPCLPGGSCVNGVELTYEADGNIATKSDVASGATYGYDIQHGHPHAVASIGALVFGYDSVGNQTSRPGLSIDYTPFDLPKKYTPTSGTPTTFDYDGDQARIRRTTPDDATVYAGTYERVTHFGMSAPPTEHRYYISSNERVVAVVTRTSQDTTTAYLHVDHLGSTDVVTGGTGAALGTVKERRSYDAFGAKRDPLWGSAGSGGWPTKTTMGFTGHEIDDDFGLVNMKGRIYDPKVGRFLSMDPIVSHPGFSQSWNPYSYVLNNPLKFVDPSGFDGYAVTTPDDASQSGSTYVLPGDTDVVGPTPGFLENLDAVNNINHDVPAAPEGDADLPAGDPLPLPDESFKDSYLVQAYVGFEVGLGLGATPGGAVAKQLAVKGGLIDEGTRTARIYSSIGEMIGGGAIAFGGAVGDIGGGAASGTGAGATVGIPVMIASTTLALGGAANVAAGGRGLLDALMSKGSGGRPPNMSPKDAARSGAFNEAKRASGVPTGQQPSRVLPNVDRRGNPQPGRVYEFEVPKAGGGTRTVRVREDAGGHDFGPGDSQNRGPHFNDEAGNHYDY